jgi:hypothetical protein
MLLKIMLLQLDQHLLLSNKFLAVNIKEASIIKEAIMAIKEANIMVVDNRFKIMLVQLIILAKIRHVMIAGVCIATTSLAIIQQDVALKSKYLARKDVVDMFQDILKLNAADMFLNTTRKQFAAKNQNIMMSKNAEPAKNGFVINIADMFQNTIGSIFAEIQTAQHLVLDKC